MSKAWDKIWEDLGVRVDTSLTDEEILAACIAYRDDTGNLPTTESGDASKYAGFPIQWSGVNARVRGFPAFYLKHGLRENRNLSDSEILGACQTYYAETGRFPTANSGDASKWVGFPITWGGVGCRIGGLESFLVANNLTKPKEISDLTILTAIKEYQFETGNLPSTDSGNATRYFGFNITWRGVHNRLGSLSDFLVKRGLKDDTHLPDTLVIQACQKYHTETGRFPTAKSGDASRYLGFKFTWIGVDRRVGSLSKFLIKHGLTERRTITDDTVLMACVAYHQETGKYPTAQSGDASKWVGFPIDWSGVNARIGSLSKFLKKHGLKP